jgi:hypothetical protein
MSPLHVEWCEIFKVRRGRLVHRSNKNMHTQYVGLKYTVFQNKRNVKSLYCLINWRSYRNEITQYMYRNTSSYVHMPSMFATYVTRRMSTSYRNSSQVCRSAAVASEILPHSSAKGRVTGSVQTWFLTKRKNNKKSSNVRSGDHGGHRVGLPRKIQVAGSCTYWNSLSSIW